MKKIFLVTGIAVFSFASAQNTTDTFWVKPLTPTPGTNSFKLPKTCPFNYTPLVLDRAKLLHTLANGNKVYALQQDNMPCVVPNMSQYNMPVMRPGIVYTIPNPAYPPGKIYLAELEKLRSQLQEHFDKGPGNDYYFNFK